MKNCSKLFIKRKEDIIKKGLRQCAKLHDFGEVFVVVVAGQQQSPILHRRLHTKI